MRRTIKIFSILLILFAAAAILGLRIYQSATAEKDNGSRGKGPPAVTVEVAPIQRASIHDIQSFTGTLIPRAQFIAAPNIGGQLKKLMVNIGDVIKKGQMIALLDDEEFVQQAEQSKAELKVAKANLEAENSNLVIAQREFERTKSLHEKKIASESELDTAQAQLEATTAKQKVAIAQVAEKEAALKAAQVRLAYTRIMATWEDGTESRIVGERFVDEGTMLTAHSPIVSILDIDSLYAVVYVIERDYPKVKIGQEAIITTDAYPAKEFRGRIVRKAPLLKKESLQARVEIEVPNTDLLLKPGMFTRVQIEFGSHEDATILPVAAIVKRNEKQGIFLLDEESMKARFVPVQLGIINGDSAELLSPSLSGLVVTLGNHLLEDGSSVILPTVQKGDAKG